MLVPTNSVNALKVYNEYLVIVVLHFWDLTYAITLPRTTTTNLFYDHFLITTRVSWH